MSSVETSYSMGTMNKDDILRLTDRGMAIFKHYLPTPFRVGRNFLNPLYEDKHASCNIYYERRSDTYKMKDFGNDDYSGDCFAFVGKLNGLDCKDSKDFIQIMKIIDRDLHLGLSSGNYIETKTITPISPAVTAATSPSKVKRQNLIRWRKRALRLRNLPSGEKRHHARGTEIIPGGFTEEVQQRE